MRKLAFAFFLPVAASELECKFMGTTLQCPDAERWPNGSDDWCNHNCNWAEPFCPPICCSCTGTPPTPKPTPTPTPPPAPRCIVDSQNTCFCGETFEGAKRSCQDGDPRSANPCPAGSDSDCTGGQTCFAQACNMPPTPAPTPAPTSVAGPLVAAFAVSGLLFFSLVLYRRHQEVKRRRRRGGENGDKRLDAALLGKPTAPLPVHAAAPVAAAHSGAPTRIDIAAKQGNGVSAASALASFAQMEQMRMDDTAELEPGRAGASCSTFEQPPVSTFEQPPVSTFEQPPVSTFEQPPVHGGLLSGTWERAR